MRKNAGAGKTALAGAVSVAMALTLGVPTTALADNWGGGVADSSQRASETRSLETDAAGAIGGENAATAQAAEPAATADAPAANATGVATTSDGTVENPVASVNGEGHATLSDAIEAAKDGGTVTLLSDVAERFTIDGDTSVTIDLAGHDIKLGSQSVVVNGVLTIDDSTAADPQVSSDYETVTYEAGTVSSTNSGYAIQVQKGGSFTLLGGAVEATNGNGVNAVGEGSVFTLDGGYVHAREYGIGVYDAAVVNVNSGVVVADDNGAIAGNGSGSRGGTEINISGGYVIGHIVTGGYIAMGIYQPQNGVINMTGGTVYADGGAGIVMRAGELNLKGGSVIASGTATGWAGDSKFSVPCAGVYYDLAANYPDSASGQNVLAISGDASVSSDKSVVPVQQTAPSNEGVSFSPSISGGTFSGSFDEGLLAEGYELTQNADGNYVAEAADPVASVNGKEYASFEAAIEAAQAGDTVTLLADAETQPVVIDEGIVIDLGGKKLSIVGKAKQDDAGITFTNGASTIKNGFIVDTCQIARTFAVVIDGSDAALTMEDATLTVEVPVKGDGYGMRVLNGAELTLNEGATVNSAPVDGNEGYIYGINVYGNGSGATFNEATATKLTVNEGATVEAYAFAVSGNGDGKKDNTLITINGGKLVSKAGPAIYHPQYGKLVINGGTLDGCSGVEIRAGELTVNGGTIKGDTSQTIVYPKDQIGGGNSVDGGGIIVAQHSTRLPVKVTVNGGTIEANTAFIQHNVMGNDQASIDKIEMSITGGEFVGALRSDDFKDADGKGFVSGGSFSDRAVGDFLAHDAAVAVNDGETPFNVYPSEDEALANGGAHKVVDEQKNSWIFSDEDAANDFAETVTGGKVEVVTRSVTFDDGIDATKDAVVAVPNGDPVAAPADPERDGYTFAGWFSDEACTQAWDFESPVTSDMTLYAKWAKVGDEGGEGPIIPIEPGDEGDGQKDDAQKDEAEGGLAGTGDAAPLAAAGAAAAVAALVAGGAAVAARRRG